MSISQLKAKAFVVETRYVWGETISDAMDLVRHMEESGWKAQGNPAPMILSGKYGTGVSISRVNYG